jgi:hypothetical protein
MFRPAPMFRSALIGAFALMAAACGQDEGAGGSTAAVAEVATQSPDTAVMHAIERLRASDFKGLVEASVPPARVEEAKARWMEEVREEEITDEDRAQFAETMNKLTAPDAEQQLMAELRPQLEQFQGEMKAQLPMMVAMGKGFIISAINESEELTAEQKPQVTNLVNALGTWAESGEFASIERAEVAVREVTAAARRMPVRTLDELHALDFDGMMNVFGIGYDGLKGMLKAYDIDMDATLASARAETVNEQGDNATVRVHFEFMGTPLTYDTQMVRVDGRWYGQETIENLDRPAGADTDGTDADVDVDADADADAASDDAAS